MVEVGFRAALLLAGFLSELLLLLLGFLEELLELDVLPGLGAELPDFFGAGALGKGFLLLTLALAGLGGGFLPLLAAFAAGFAFSGPFCLLASIKSCTAASTAFLSGELLREERLYLLGDREWRGDLGPRRGLRDFFGLYRGLRGLRLRDFLPEDRGLRECDLRALGRDPDLLDLRGLALLDFD